MHKSVLATITRHRKSFMLFLIAVVALSGCAAASAAKATDLPEKAVTDIASLAGTWKGTLATGAPLETTINRDGTWTNVLPGGRFEGRATVTGGKVRTRSDTTGRAYIWRLHEGGGRRVLFWLNDPDESLAGTVEFTGAR